MSSEHHIQISAEAEAIRRNITDVGLLRRAMCKTMELENEKTVRYITLNKLSASGPMTLGVVSGFLRKSIRPSLPVESGGVIYSSIGSNLRYAAAHEFGLNKDVPVKEHQRRNSIRDQWQTASGEAVNRFHALRAGLLSKNQVSQAVVDSGKYTLAKRGAKKTAMGVNITVKAHTMHARQKARHYVYNGIKDRAAQYGDALSQTILRIWKGGK